MRSDRDGIHAGKTFLAIGGLTTKATGCYQLLEWVQRTFQLASMVVIPLSEYVRNPPVADAHF
jgi:hypothetical protein